MASIKDDRGYNQGFKPSKALEIRTARRCDYMVSKMDLNRPARILEIGCGTGELSYLLARKTGRETVGTDICVPFVQEARHQYQLKNLRFEVLDFSKKSDIAATLGYTQFDYIVGNGILHHLYQNIEQSLKSLYEILSKGGKIIFLEPNVLNPYCFLIFKFPFFRKLANLEPGEMAFTKQFITDKLLASSFTNVEVLYKDFLLPVTPDLMIKPLITAGDLLERVPVVRNIAQSIFITATKKE
jgi:2-polyprenyl-3-methyl-5-hydroxy-6-metoxy-1,4-benzoquinol methylase